MDQAVKRYRESITFNGPLEAGIRTVAVLGKAYPQSYDLQRLVAFDYLLVHTGDVGGPNSLHPPAPQQSTELLVRRKLVEQGILLMLTRNLVEREISPDGIRYLAGENAVLFLDSLESTYLKALKARADWLVTQFGNWTEQEFHNLMRKFFNHWIEEFQAIERSLGADR